MTRIRAKRRDANHATIRDAFRSMSCGWIDTADQGDGCPDGIAMHKGRVWLIEIKDPSQPPSKRRLTDAEEWTHIDAARHGVIIHVIETVEQVAKLVNTVR